MDIINIEQLRKSFGKLQVLNGVTASFNQGQSVAIVGPNASGKTTLIKCILGIVIPDEGKIVVDGVSTANSYHYKVSIGYMPQIGRYPGNITIGQLFAMMKDIRGMKDEKLDDELFDLFGLMQMSGKPLRTLSGGTLQKVSAALAFLFNPKILILDEPTAGLDPLASEILKEKILKSTKAGKLVIITSHLMNEVEEIADRILYMMDGSVKFYKTLDQIRIHTGEQKLGKALASMIQNDNYA